MELFKKLAKKESYKPDFTNIDTMEKAIECYKQGILQPLYLMPLRFHGEESSINRLFVPPIIVELKDRYDNMVEDLLVQEKVNGYSCSPEYKGKSLIPARMTVIASKDGVNVFSQTIEIW